MGQHRTNEDNFDKGGWERLAEYNRLKDKLQISKERADKFVNFLTLPYRTYVLN